MQNNCGTEFIRKEITKILVSKFRVDKSLINDAAKLNDLGLESLDDVEAIMLAEKKFRIHIPDIMTEKLKTIGDLIKCVECVRNPTILGPDKTFFCVGYDLCGRYVQKGGTCDLHPKGGPCSTVPNNCFDYDKYDHNMVDDRKVCSNINCCVGYYCKEYGGKKL